MGLPAVYIELLIGNCKCRIQKNAAYFTYTTRLLDAEKLRGLLDLK
jgi:hypothetical protein